MLCYHFICFNCAAALFCQNKASRWIRQSECDHLCVVSVNTAFLFSLFFFFKNTHSHRTPAGANFKTRADKKFDSGEQYINKHPLASQKLCPNNILKHLHLAIHHGDSNLTLSHLCCSRLATLHTKSTGTHIYAQIKQDRLDTQRYTGTKCALLSKKFETYVTY